MRKFAFLAAGLAIAAIVSTDASAAVKAYWDQATGKWIKYDIQAGRVVGTPERSSNVGTGTIAARNASPIKRQVIDYDGPFRKNTIVVNTAERRLYYVLGDGKALRYGVGVGREGFQWSGTNVISRKAEWPGWTPPPEMIERERKKGRILPAYMEGGPNNPLGARALYIGGTLYRIHGSNEPWSIGRAVSSGCIRLTNDDIVHLYNQVKVGTRVVVLSGNESKNQLMALASPPPPPAPVEEKPAVVADIPAEEAVAAADEPAAAGEDAGAEVAALGEDADGPAGEVGAAAEKVAAVATDAPLVKDDEVVVVAPTGAVDTAVETGSVQAPVRVKDDDVIVKAVPAGPTDKVAAVPVKDDDVVVTAPAATVETPVGPRVKDDELVTPVTPPATEPATDEVTAVEPATGDAPAEPSASETVTAVDPVRGGAPAAEPAKESVTAAEPVEDVPAGEPAKEDVSSADPAAGDVPMVVAEEPTLAVN